MQKKKKKGRSTPNIRRGMKEGQDRILRDYFGNDPLYSPETFKSRFRVSHSIYQRLEEALTDQTRAGTIFFIQRPDATGLMGAHPKQKILAVLRMLGTGIASDHLDDNFRISSTTIIASLKEFSKCVLQIFGPEYLRGPTEEEMQGILDWNASRSMPGCLGSIDCTHFWWSACPHGDKGSFSGKEGYPTIILEGVSDHTLRLWSAYVGPAGVSNDLVVLGSSPILDNYRSGNILRMKYTLNGQERTLPYYRADGIYPCWPIFAKTWTDPIEEKHKAYAKVQESLRKEIECCFGVLKKRWKILSDLRMWNKSECVRIIKTCVILHNMLCEEGSVLRQVDESGDFDRVAVEEQIVRIRSDVDYMNKNDHSLLIQELAEHVYARNLEYRLQCQE